MRAEENSSQPSWTAVQIAEETQESIERVCSVLNEMQIRPVQIIAGQAHYDMAAVQMVRRLLTPGMILGLFSPGKGWIRGS